MISNKFFPYVFLISFILELTLGGIIQPDDELPLEISPSYGKQIGRIGTKFIFRFYITNNLDKNNMPTFRGYGGSNAQYIGNNEFLYQSATSGYLFYLGSLIVFYNKIKTNSLYDLPNEPLIIPYYCPYYHTEGEEDPFSLGIFPSFIAGFGNFESMTNFGNKGFEKLVAKKINKKQLNVVMLSNSKIAQVKNDDFKHFYNTVKFINHYDTNMMILDVWNSNENGPCDNQYDSIDSFVFFFF